MTDPDADWSADSQKETVSRGVEIRTKLKRGTGTRDQDTTVIKAKGRDADEALRQLARARKGIDQQDFLQWARDQDPERIPDMATEPPQGDD